MSKKKLFILLAAAMGALPVFAIKSQSLQLQNSLRVGYDDNIYSREDEDGSAFITDIINISGKLTFSSRSDLLMYWQPEFRYRLDADPNTVSYQDLYGKYSHALTQRLFFQISDRFRYQDKEAKADNMIVTDDQNYIENNVMASADYMLSARSHVKVGAGYELRTWDDEHYGNDLGNDYDEWTAHGSILYDIKPESTVGLIGAMYTDLSYDGDRGGYDATTVYGGLDHNLTANIVGTVRLGYTYTSVDREYGDDEDSSSPYLQAGLQYQPTARTSLSASFVYSMYRAENSYYNAQDRFNVGVGLRHDLTAKISVSTSLGYTYGNYDSDYVRDENYTVQIGDAHDQYVTFNIRASYQVNRNNFLDAGYHFSYLTSNSDYLNEYTRNVFDIGWRLRL